MTLTWDDSYAIAQELSKLKPEVDLEEVSLMMIFDWTLDLPGFADDPELAISETVFELDMPGIGLQRDDLDVGRN